MNSFTQNQTVAALRGSIEVVYVIECGRCGAKHEQRFGAAPKGKGDLTFAAESAYNDGWGAVGSRFQSDGELNGEFCIDPLCRACLMPIEKDQA